MITYVLEDLLLRIGWNVRIEFDNGGFLAELRDSDGIPICCSSLCTSTDAALRSLVWKLNNLTPK